MFQTPIAFIKFIWAFGTPGCWGHWNPNCFYQIPFKFLVLRVGGALTHHFCTRIVLCYLWAQSLNIRLFMLFAQWHSELEWLIHTAKGALQGPKPMAYQATFVPFLVTMKVHHTLIYVSCSWSRFHAHWRCENFRHNIAVPGTVQTIKYSHPNSNHDHTNLFATLYDTLCRTDHLLFRHPLCHSPSWKKKEYYCTKNVTEWNSRYNGGWKRG